MYRKLFMVVVALATVACVQKTRKRTIVFAVDAKGVKNLSSLGVRGELQPLSWSETLPLQDTDGDSIYNGTITFDIPYDYVELKFVANGEDYELKEKPNRMVALGKRDTLYYMAKFDKED